MVISVTFTSEDVTNTHKDSIVFRTRVKINTRYNKNITNNKKKSVRLPIPANSVSSFNNYNFF